MCPRTTLSRWSEDLTLGGEGERVRHTGQAGAGTRPLEGRVPSGRQGARSPLFPWAVRVLQKVWLRAQSCVWLQPSPGYKDWQE